MYNGGGSLGVFNIQCLHEFTFIECILSSFKNKCRFPQKLCYFPAISWNIIFREVDEELQCRVHSLATETVMVGQRMTD